MGEEILRILSLKTKIFDRLKRNDKLGFYEVKDGPKFTDFFSVTKQLFRNSKLLHATRGGAGATKFSK